MLNINSQVDIVIIGDSRDGHDVLKKIASTRPSIKIAFISREFKLATTRDYLNVEYIKDEVIYTDYKNRLFGVYLKNGDRIYCTHLIIASGLAYEPFVIGHKLVPSVYNNADDIAKIAKNNPAVVLCEKNSDVRFALAVAKKYKHVYMCTKTFDIADLTAANRKKLRDASNIVVLPNTTISKVYLVDGQLQKVDLDNYSTVTCQAIFVKTASKPETSFVSNICGKDANGFLVTSSSGESLLVPKCFAIGACAAKTTQKMKAKIIESVLTDFTGGTY